MNNIIFPSGITNKCLKYPICKYKTFINCEGLFIYFTNRLEQHYNLIYNPLPCIANKCLKYTTCKYNKHIDCKELHVYYHEFINQLKQHDNFDDVYAKEFGYIKTVFPNLKGIIGMWNHIHKILPNIRHLYADSKYKSYSI